MPNILSLFEMAEKRAALKKERETAKAKADEESKLEKEKEKEKEKEGGTKVETNDA